MGFKEEKDNLRQTTIKAKGRTGLAVLNLGAFFKAVKRVRERNLNEKTEFLSKIPVLALLSQ